MGFVKWGMEIGSGLLDLVCSIMFAGLGFLIWVHWEGESLANVGFLKCILQSRVCGMGFAGWSYLNGGYKVGFVGWD